MPAHTLTLDGTLTKTDVGFNIEDLTSYPASPNNHRREEFIYWLIVVDDPRGYRFIMSSHQFILDTYNLIDSPATVAVPPLIIPKSNSGAGRYYVYVYGVPQFDVGGLIEDNYGAGDCFCYDNAGVLEFYSVVTNVTPSTDTNLASTVNYTRLDNITKVGSRYKISMSSFFVMKDWLDCYKQKIHAAYCVVNKDPFNQKKHCKNDCVELAANLMGIKLTLLALESGDVTLDYDEEKKITNLANALCCCKLYATEDPAESETPVGSVGGTGGTGGTGGPEGIGFWYIEDDFIVS